MEKIKFPTVEQAMVLAGNNHLIEILAHEDPDKFNLELAEVEKD